MSPSVVYSATGEIRLTGVEVDGLGPDEDHRVLLVAERLEGVEQDPTGQDVQRLRSARHLRSYPSRRAALPPPRARALGS